MATEWVQDDGLASPMSVAGANPRALAVDSSGNAYVVGQKIGLGNIKQIGLWKYDSSGALDPNFPVAWPPESYNITDNSGIAVALGPSGSIYVAGVGPGKGSGLDFLTLKVSATGAIEWVRRYDNAFLDDFPVAIGVDQVTESVYVAGTSGGVGTGMDYAILKYSSAGSGPLVARFDGIGQGDKLSDMVVVSGFLPAGGSTGVYVTGTSYQGELRGTDYATIKYDANLNRAWLPWIPDGVAYFDRGGDDEAAALALGSSLFVTGSSWGAGGNFDYATLAYSPSTGAPTWSQPSILDGGGQGHDYARRVAVDEQNIGQKFVYVTGSSWEGPFRKRDLTTVCYWSGSGGGVGGAEEWRTSYDRDIGGDEEGLDIVCELGVAVYVTGRSSNGTFDDYISARYDHASGLYDWSTQVVFFSNMFVDQGFALRLGPPQFGMRTLYVLGRTMDDWLNDRLGLVKYVQTP